MKLSKHFELVVFTASHRNYAEAVIDLLDPQKELISLRLSREHCHRTEEGIHMKDLRIFEGARKLENLVIEDNSLYCFGFQMDRGIPILPFYQDPLDSELEELEEFLLKLKQDFEDGLDLSKIIREHFFYDILKEHCENQL